MATADRLMSDPQPLRLLYILDGFPDPGAGTEGQFWLLLRGLDRARVTPGVVLLRPSAFLERELRGVPLRVLNVYRLRSLRSLWRVAATAWWARRSGFRVAHIYFNDSAMVFPPVLRLLGIKVIVSRRDMGFWYTPAILPILKIVAGFVDRVVANCEAVRQVTLASEGYPPDRVQVIYNGIGQSVTSDSAAVRQDYGVPEGVPLLVIVANLRPLKRVGDAVRALAGVTSPSGLAPHLLVVGEDRTGIGGESHRAELERVGQEMGVSDRLHFAGKMTDPMPVIALADACVLCSETEGLSNVVLEYMRAGKPVVCTAVGGNPELVLDGQTGRLVPVGDVVRLSGALTDVLADPVRARHWGEAAKQRALELFGVSGMIERHQQLYEALAASGSGTGRGNGFKE